MDSNRALTTRKSRSLRIQHSISLHIPVEDLSYSNLNCFIDLPKQVFNLTYIGENDTQNPDSLGSLQEFSQGKWQIFLVGFLDNFTYVPSQIESLSQHLDKALTTQFSSFNSQETYHSNISVVEDLQPTENDNSALLITVYKGTPESQVMVYKGYLMSWCNPMKEDRVLLPILVCCGQRTYQMFIHSIISEMFDIVINKLALSQEEFMHLSTYCLLMLHENDTYFATIGYKTPFGALKVKISVSTLIQLWKKIHKQEEEYEVELEDVLLFHEAIDQHVESTYGIKMGIAHFEYVTVTPIFRLEVNSQFWCKSTKILHVVLKYLNFLAVQKLKKNYR